MDQRRDARFGYLLSAVLVCVLYIACCIVVFVAIRERRGGVVERREPFRRSIKPVFTFQPYTRLMLAFLFVSLGMQITQGNLALYTTHSLKRGEHMAFAIIMLLVSAIGFVPVLQILSSKLGKKTVFAACNMIYLPLLLTATFLPEGVHPAVIYFFMVIAGVVVASAFLMPWSMLPDAIDAHMLQYGCRNEAAFYSFYVFFNKFATGVSLGLSQIVLGLSGYNEKSLCPQPDSVGRSLRILFGPVPMVFVIISTIFIYLYPINEAERARMAEELRKVKQCLAGSKSDRLSCVSSSATLPSMIHSVDDFNSRTALAPRSAMVRSDSRV